jgi:hypothetical protein
MKEATRTMSTFDVMQGNSCKMSFFSYVIKGTLKIGNFDQHLQKHQMYLTQET